MPDDHFVTSNEIRRATGRPDSSLRRDIAHGTFPPLVAVGPGRRGMLQSELDLIVAARLAGASLDEQRALVRQIVEHRMRLAAALGLEVN